MKTRLGVTLLLVLCVSATPAEDGDVRQAWSVSRITGSPEPPPPYRTERVFPNLTFKDPLEIVYEPGSKRFFVLEHKGKIYSFKNDPAVAKADLFLDVAREAQRVDLVPNAKGVEAVYGLAFHPDFAKNRYCYVMYALEHQVQGKNLPQGSRVSRFTVSAGDPPQCDPRSEKLVIDWPSGGHNGCCLRFGPDGMLYVSTGDGGPASPPDVLDTGQDLSDLLGAILRIDVNRVTGDKAYAVPPDNPFVKTPGARPEHWAYGLRNPWRMSFDPATGALWAGDVGWEAWEMIYRIERGGNYGWSVTEGPGIVNAKGKRGPTPILPPALAIPHPEAASITGGLVYRGKKLPGLVGKYVFADFEMFRLYAARVDGSRLIDLQDLGRTGPRIVAFGEDGDGEIYLLDYAGGGIHGIVPNKEAKQNHRFPRTLTETGLFASVKEQQPSVGVYPYSINSELHAGQASARRYLALPGATSIVSRGRFLDPPRDAVLVKTLSLEMERGNPATRRHVETQLLHYDGRDWQAYTYRWNEAQTDAALVPAAGAEQTFDVKDPQASGGRHAVRWLFHGRATCTSCHAVYWGRSLLGFEASQLDRGGQWERLKKLRLLVDPPGTKRSPNRPKPLANVHAEDATASAEARARAYLHANCAHCHRPGGGTSAMLDLRGEVSADATHAIDVRPALGGFDLPDARLVAPGDPARSVLVYRMAKAGAGRMPRLDPHDVDTKGLELVARWIATMKPASADAALEGRRQRERKALAELRAGKVDALDGLAGSTSAALDLVLGMDGLPDEARREAIARGAVHPTALVRDLFERFIPPDRRPRRLGNKFDPAGILAHPGDRERGRSLFFERAGLACSSCHTVAGRGDSFGPDLSKIGTKYKRAELLEHVVQPSKQVDDRYATYVVELSNGKSLTGLLVEKTDRTIVLRNADKQEHRIPAASIERLTPQKTSSMPEQLLADLTAREAADLLAFLTSLE